LKKKKRDLKIRKRSCPTGTGEPPGGKVPSSSKKRAFDGGNLKILEKRRECQGKRGGEKKTGCTLISRRVKNYVGAGDGGGRRPRGRLGGGGGGRGQRRGVQVTIATHVPKVFKGEKRKGLLRAIILAKGYPMIWSTFWEERKKGSLK